MAQPSSAQFNEHEHPSCADNTNKCNGKLKHMCAFLIKNSTAFALQTTSQLKEKKFERKTHSNFFGAGDRGRTGTVSPPLDFEFYRLRGNEWTVIPYGGP